MQNTILLDVAPRIQLLEQLTMSEARAILVATNNERIETVRHLIATIYSIRAAAFASIFLSLLLGFTAMSAAAQSAEAQALIKKFGLRESRQPIREMANWKVPAKVVV